MTAPLDPALAKALHLDGPAYEAPARQTLELLDVAAHDLWNCIAGALEHDTASAHVQSQVLAALRFKMILDRHMADLERECFGRAAAEADAREQAA